MSIFADNETDETHARIKEASDDPVWGAFVESMLKEGWDTAVRRADATDRQTERVDTYAQSPHARGFYTFVKEAYDARDEAEEMAKYASQIDPENQMHAGAVEAAEAILKDPIEKVAMEGPKEAFLTPGDSDTYDELMSGPEPSSPKESLSDVFSGGSKIKGSDSITPDHAKSMINNNGGGKKSLGDVFGGKTKNIGADVAKKKIFGGNPGLKTPKPSPGLLGKAKKKLTDAFGS